MRRNEFGPESLRLAESAAQSFPDSVKVRLYLGNLLLLNGKYAEAEREFGAVLSKEPGHVPARKNLAVLLENQGRRAEAAEQFREAAEGAKVGCPVSQALEAVPITLEASFAE